jgi:hypothetical protein
MILFISIKKIFLFILNKLMKKYFIHIRYG